MAGSVSCVAPEFRGSGRLARDLDHPGPAQRRTTRTEAASCRWDQIHMQPLPRPQRRPGTVAHGERRHFALTDAGEVRTPERPIAPRAKPGRASDPCLRTTHKPSVHILRRARPGSQRDNHPAQQVLRYAPHDAASESQVLHLAPRTLRACSPPQRRRFEPPGSRGPAGGWMQEYLARPSISYRKGTFLQNRPGCSQGPAGEMADPAPEYYERPPPGQKAPRLCRAAQLKQDREAKIRALNGARPDPSARQLPLAGEEDDEKPPLPLTQVTGLRPLPGDPPERLACPGDSPESLEWLSDAIVGLTSRGSEESSGEEPAPFSISCWRPVKPSGHRVERKPQRFSFTDVADAVMSGADLPPDHPDQLESLSPVTQAVMQWTPEDDPNGEPDSPTTDGEPDWPTDSFEAIRALPTVQAALVEHNREPEPERLFDTEIPQAKPGDSDLGPHEGAPLAATSPAGSPVPASPEKPAVSPPSEPQEFEVVTITVPPRAKPGDPITLKNGSRIKVPGTINGHTAAPGDRFKVKLPKAKPSPSVETGNPVNDPAENQPVNATPSDQTPSEMVQRRMAGSPGEVRTRVLGPPGTRSKPDWICKDGEADPEVAGQPRKEVTVEKTVTGDTTVIKTTTKTFHPDGRVQTHIKTETKRVSGGEQPAPAEEPTTRAAAGGGTKAEEDAAAQAKVVLFKVPDGAEPGTQVQAAIRGKKFPVTIPDGKKPGDTFEITIPTDGDPPSESSVHPSQAVSDETTPEASEPSLPKDALLSPDEWYTKLLNDRSKSKPEQESEIAATPDSEPAAQELESEPTAEASAPASGEEDPEARARWAWVDHLEGQCSPAWFGRHRRFPTSIEAGWLLGTSSVVLAEVASTLAGIGALANLRELQALFLVRQWRKNCARPECPVACRQTSSLLRAGGAV